MGKIATGRTRAKTLIRTIEGPVSVLIVEIVRRDITELNPKLRGDSANWGSTNSNNLIIEALMSF